MDRWRAMFEVPSAAELEGLSPDATVILVQPAGMGSGPLAIPEYAVTSALMQTDRASQSMGLREVLRVLDDLAEAGCAVWVAGGWGVDALVGRQTRLHRDLDLAVDARNETVALRVLGRRGYRVETDWRPVRVELIAEGSGWVDVHPVVFDASGYGCQADLGGGQFDYPPEAFDQGSLGGVRVPCLSRDQQLLFHTNYEPCAIDLHDLALLEHLTSRG